MPIHGSPKPFLFLIGVAAKKKTFTAMILHDDKGLACQIYPTNGTGLPEPDVMTISAVRLLPFKIGFYLTLFIKSCQACVCSLRNQWPSPAMPC
jgi:hypothetical protein